eukprot:scpid66676/ scgid10968/ Leucine-rich repeat-containing protein 58
MFSTMSKLFPPGMDLRASGKQYESTETISALVASKQQTLNKVDYPRKLNISRNLLQTISSDFFSALTGIVELDISDNRLKLIEPGLAQLPHLTTIDLRGNSLHTLPDDFPQCSSLEEVNLGENALEAFPIALFSMPNLKKVYLASNKITKLPSEIKKMTSLEVLFLGDNRLSALPDEIAELANLGSLTVSHNQLTSVPLAVCEMHNLVSLQLHNNRLETLPPALLQMVSLHEISLRNNPLVSRFVREHVDEVPSLGELAARAVRNGGVSYSSENLPPLLVAYLDSSQRCDNPACRGVYFHTSYKQVKFVDFCGKYRIPFLHYLCSPQCHQAVPGHSSAFSGQSQSSNDDTGDESEQERRKMRRVLLPLT